jgi:hypothetical protein
VSFGSSSSWMRDPPARTYQPAFCCSNRLSPVCPIPMTRICCSIKCTFPAFSPGKTTCHGEPPCPRCASAVHFSRLKKGRNAHSSEVTHACGASFGCLQRRQFSDQHAIGFLGGGEGCGWTDSNIAASPVASVRRVGKKTISAVADRIQ